MYLNYTKSRGSLDTKYIAVMISKYANGMANNADTDWIAQKQSDLSLHCLLGPICPKI